MPATRDAEMKIEDVADESKVDDLAYSLRAIIRLHPGLSTGIYFREARKAIRGFCGDLIARIEGFEKDARKLRRQAGDAEDAQRNAQRELSKLEKLLSDRTKESRKAKRDLATAESTNESLASKLKRSQRRISELEAALDRIDPVDDPFAVEDDSE